MLTFVSLYGRARSLLADLAKDEQGVVTVEWVAIAGVFVVIAVATFLLIGEHVNTILSAVEGQLESITEHDLFAGGGGGDSGTTD